MVFWVVFGFLLYCWFSIRFFLFSKNFRDNQTIKTTKSISKGGSETFKKLVLLVLPKVVLIFFGFLWYFWFSQRSYWFSKNLRENQQITKQTYPRVGLKPLNTLLLFVFPKVFFCMFGFPEAFSKWSRCLGFRY